MRLRQLKIRGLGTLPETGWLTLSPSITLLLFPHKNVGRQFLQTVQSLNPTFDCHTEKPFKDIPLETVSANGYRKMISPEKKTIVFGIFDTPPLLVTELGAITPPLYETDRVEIGRRLDYSRWINFVEIASSTRWSEVSEDIGNLLRSTNPGNFDDQHIHRLVKQTAPTDRVKGTAAEELFSWLAGLRAHYPDLGSLDEIEEKVGRARKFSQARQLITQRLPQFLSMKSSQDPQLPSFEKTAGESQIPPILLVDCFDGGLSKDNSVKIGERISLFAKDCQCLCFADESLNGLNLTDEQVISAETLNLK